MMPRLRPVPLLLLLMGAWLLGAAIAGPVRAQAPAGADTARSSTAADVPALDRRALLAVHRADGPLVAGAMRTADAAAPPLFYGAVPVAWGAALLRGTGYDDAYRLALAGGLALGAALGLKRAVGRARPYRTLPAVQSRSEAYRPGQEGDFAETFPSGHATVAFALATSWSLSHPEAYIVGPAFAGATLIGASRLWLGVHYPSDVLAGALLGAGAAVAVYLVRGAITPGALAADDSSGHAAAALHGPTVRIRLPLP